MGKKSQEKMTGMTFEERVERNKGFSFRLRRFLKNRTGMANNSRSGKTERWRN